MPLKNILAAAAIMFLTLSGCATSGSYNTTYAQPQDWPSSRHYGRLLAHRGRFDRFRATTSMVVYFRLVQKQTRALKPSSVMWRALVSTTERTMNRQGKGKRRLGSRPIGKPGRGARTVGARSLPNHVTFHKAVGCRNMADRCNRTAERSDNCASTR